MTTSRTTHWTDLWLLARIGGLVFRDTRDVLRRPIVQCARTAKLSVQYRAPCRRESGCAHKREVDLPCYTFHLC